MVFNLNCKIIWKMKFIESRKPCFWKGFDKTLENPRPEFSSVLRYHSLIINSNQQIRNVWLPGFQTCHREVTNLRSGHRFINWLVKPGKPCYIVLHFGRNEIHICFLPTGTWLTTSMGRKKCRKLFQSEGCDFLLTRFTWQPIKLIVFFNTLKIPN